ncbi:MAG: HD domain-containing protein [Victivallales bacterium]|nr:HD domain-containing protein [Victivallales bacterium]
MKATLSETIFTAVAAYVRERLASAPGCHDFDHTLRVLHNSLKLHDMEQDGDSAVIRLAALLHDIARPEEMQSSGRICHAEAGAQQVDAILTQCGVTDPELIRQVAAAVRRHRYRGQATPETIEEKIIYDADKLDSLGCVGIGRAFHFAGRIGARLHNTAAEAVNGEAYGREDSAYREYLVKLQGLPEKMLTASGRKLAKHRAERMATFFQQLEQEINGA